MESKFKNYTRYSRVGDKEPKKVLVFYINWNVFTIDNTKEPGKNDYEN